MKHWKIIGIFLILIIVMLANSGRLLAQFKASQIKVGMTRADLERIFEHDGGFSYGPNYNYEVYFLKENRCDGYKTWHTKVSFRPFDIDLKRKMEMENRGLYNNPKDVITDISKLYCESQAAD